MSNLKRELEKKTYKLFRGQHDELERLHPNIPVSRVLRQLIDSYVEKRKSMEKTVTIEIEVPDL